MMNDQPPTPHHPDVEQLARNLERRSDAAQGPRIQCGGNRTLDPLDDCPWPRCSGTRARLQQGLRIMTDQAPLLPCPIPAKQETEMSIWMQGHVAQQRGAHVTTNPHHKGSAAWFGWRAGYFFLGNAP